MNDEFNLFSSGGNKDRQYSIEPEYSKAFWAWQDQPTPATTTTLMHTIQPSIDRAVAAHADNNDAITRGKAKRLALSAIKTYDPARGVKLNTYLSGQLQSLRRSSRKRQQILSQPERIALEKGTLDTATAELEDRLGRLPTTEELADHTGFPVKRISYIRRFKSPVAEGSLVSRSDEGDGGTFDVAVADSNNDIWAELVYGDLDVTNKQILEWSLGLHGQKPMNNQQIAVKLRMTPGAVTQRKAAIQKLLDQQTRLRLF